MKKLRVLSLVMAVVLLFGTIAVLSSCKKKEKQKDPVPNDLVVSEETTAVDLSAYTLVYANSGKDGSITTTFKTQMLEFGDTLGSATGVKFLANQENRTSSQSADPEILIGNTSRAESAKALESISGHGYTIQVINNKVVINGTTNLFVLQGVQYFVENVLGGMKSVTAKLTLNNSVTLSNAEVLTIADSEQCYFNFVYSSKLDTDDSQTGDREVYYGIVSGTGRDYAYDVIQDMQTNMAKMTNQNKKNFSSRQLMDTTEATEHEIIVSDTTRPESAACRAELDQNEYGVFVRDGDIILSAWNNAALQMCGTRFLDYIYESQYTDADGNYSIIVPADLKFVANYNEKWVTNFPKPEGEGVDLYTTAEAEPDSLVYVYMGNGVNAAAYEAYTQKLTQNGYRLYGEKNEAEDSIFATYTNKQQNVFLYVSYNAYKHAEGVGYSYDDPTIRIVSTPLDSVNLLPTKNLSQRNVTKKVDSCLTAVALPGGSVGTGYVMMMEDGKFIVLDGGTDQPNEAEIDNLYTILYDLYVKAYGTEPTREKPIEITAWFISHNHGDHTGVFYGFSEKFGQLGKTVSVNGKQTKAFVTLEYVMGNFPAPSVIYNTGEASTFMQDYMERMQAFYTTPFTFVKVYTGQKIYFANVEIEVLFTNEDMVPQRIVTLNDSSTILRFTMTPSDRDEYGAKIKGDPVSFVFTGDAYIHGGRWCSATYGADYLDSDMVAVAHHGGPGTLESLYDDVQAETVWVPNTMASYNSYMNGGSWYAKVDQYVCEEMECVERIIVADTYNTTVFFKVDGPDFANFYAAGSGEYYAQKDECIIIK